MLEYKMHSKYIIHCVTTSRLFVFPVFKKHVLSHNDIMFLSHSFGLFCPNITD